MGRRSRTFLMTAVVSFFVVAQAFAGEFFETEGVAIRGYDPVAYFTDMKPVKGSAEFRAEYQGSTFHFSSAAHRDAFLGNPTKFAPQYGGYCAFGVAKGYKATTDPAAFTVTGGKLYLNYNGTVRALWVLDIQGYVKKADENWPTVRNNPHATN